MSDLEPTATTAPAARTPILELAAVGLLVVGALGPWATFAGLSKAGLDGDGVITLAVAFIVAGFVIRARIRGGSIPLAALLVPGLIALAIAIIDILDVRDIGLDVGWGLWLTAVGAVVLLAAAVRRIAGR